MTVLTNKMRIGYVGDGVTTDYTYDFEIPNADEVSVMVDYIATNEYTISGLGDPNGGQVMFTTAPADQSVIDISRNVDYTQAVDYRPYDPFPAETHEDALDRIVMMIQQLDDELDRAVKSAIDSPEGLDLTFPNPGAGEFVKYTDDGLALETADINELGTTIVASATDQEMIDGVQTQTRLISPYQTALSAETHQDPPLTSVFDVDYIVVADVLPATPDPAKLYLIRE